MSEERSHRGRGPALRLAAWSLAAWSLAAWIPWSALAVLGATSCGGVVYSLRIVQASDALARAEQLGAATRAPYEYHYALEHLRKAREQASRSEYGAAERLADTAH